MKAVHKSDVTGALEFRGITAVYPQWFQDQYIGDFIEQTPYGLDVYYSEEGEVALAEGDVFLYNEAGEILWLDPIVLEEDYYLIRGVWAIGPSMFICEKTEALECVIFEGMDGYYPDWFQDKVLDHYISDLMGVQPANQLASELYLEGEGTDIIQLGDVFLMNRVGDVRRVDQDEFETHWFIID